MTNSPTTIEQVIERALDRCQKNDGYASLSEGDLNAIREALSRKREAIVSEEMIEAGCGAAGVPNSPTNRRLMKRIYLAMEGARV